jgi:hypothetical protein
VLRRARHNKPDPSILRPRFLGYAASESCSSSHAKPSPCGVPQVARVQGNLALARNWGQCRQAGRATQHDNPEQSSTYASAVRKEDRPAPPPTVRRPDLSPRHSKHLAPLKAATRPKGLCCRPHQLVAAQAPVACAVGKRAKGATRQQFGIARPIPGVGVRERSFSYQPAKLLAFAWILSRTSRPFTPAGCDFAAHQYRVPDVWRGIANRKGYCGTTYQNNPVRVPDWSPKRDPAAPCGRMPVLQQYSKERFGWQT